MTLGCPDSEWQLRAYENPEHEYWAFARTLQPRRCETQIDSLNYLLFRQSKVDGEHRYAWNEETLTRTLRQSGLTNISRRPFDPRLDSERRRIGTLYMHAIKP